MIPLVAGVIVGFFMMKKEKRYNKRNIISLALHLLLCVSLSFAFANPQILVTNSNTDVYILADASASSKESQTKIDKAINKTKEEAEKVPGTKVGVIAFGKNAVVLSKPGEKFNSIKDAYSNDSFDYTATDIKSALDFTVTQFDENVIKRITLISDGVETDNSAVDAMSTIMSKGIHLDAVDIDADYTHEVSLTSLAYNDSTFLNRDEQVDVTINATDDTNATVSLYLNDKVSQSKDTHLSNGVNIVSFTLDTSIAGTYNYKVVVSATKDVGFLDTFTENNSRLFTQDVSDKFNLLFIGNTTDELTQFKALGGFSSNTKVDAQIKGSSTRFTKVPTELTELIKYDEIVLSNVDLKTIKNYDKFISNLNIAVREYGKSVLTLGNTHLMDYKDDTKDVSLSTYNDMLPVQSQPSDSRAVVLLIDSSGSMSGASLSNAKEGAKEVAKLLNKGDQISVVTFESNVTIVQPMTSITSEDGRNEIIKNIENKITSGGGTEMLKGLEAAYGQIKGIAAEYKSIITLTDGQSSDTDESLRDKVINISNENISCSFIDIGYQNGVALLKRLAKLGNGRFQYLDSSSILNLSNIMKSFVTNETIDEVEINENAEIQYLLKKDKTLQGVVNKLGSIGGYYYSRSKDGASTVLSVQYVKMDSTYSASVIAVPLYAYWNYGLGKVSTFSSSIGGTNKSWTNTLRGTLAGKTFFKNMISQSLPDKHTDSILSVSYTPNGSSVNLSVSPNVSKSDATLTAKITDSNTNTSTDYTLTFDGETYSAVISTPTTGQYKAELTYTGTDDSGKTESVTSKTFINFDYSKEFNFFDDNSNDLLYSLTKQAGGDLYDVDNIQYKMSDDEKVHASYLSTNVYILLLSVIIYLADIAVRKMTFRRRKKGGKEPESNTQVTF